MQKFCAADRNLYLVANEDKELQPMIETVIVVSEPLETIRFHTTPAGLRNLAEQFLSWADEADDLQKKPDSQST